MTSDVLLTEDDGHAEGLRSQGKRPVLTDTERSVIVARLRRIEGQIKGVQRMLEEDRDPPDVLTQIAAVRAATTAVGTEVLVAYALHCLRHPEEFAAPEAAIERATKALVRTDY